MKPVSITILIISADSMSTDPRTVSQYSSLSPKFHVLSSNSPSYEGYGTILLHIAISRLG